MSPDRRDFLTVASAAVSACGLAACSRPTTGMTAVPTSGDAPTPASAIEVATSDVPVGGGKILADAQLVVTQPTAGDYRAFSALCPHKGCPVSSIEGDVIVCRCHDSRFALADGAVKQGPAESPLTAATVTVQGDKLLVKP